jgi:hypothetical protein
MRYFRFFRFSVALAGMASSLGLLANSPGSLLWEFNAEGPLTHPGVADIAPAVAPDGTIHFGAATDEGGIWYALRPEGTLAWSHSLETQPTSPGSFGHDGTVYFGSYNNLLHAVWPDGSLRWNLELAGRVYAPLAVGSNGVVYFTSLDQHLHAVTADGDLLWSFPTGIDPYAGPVIAGDGSIYLSAGTELIALTPAGQVLWRHRVFNNITETPALAADGTIYVADSHEYFYAVNPAGTRLWERRFQGQWKLTSPVVGADGTIYLGSAGYRVTAVWPDGTIRWEYPAEARVLNGLALGMDGMVYFNLQDGALLALDSNGQMVWDYSGGPGFNTAPTLSPDGILFLGDVSDRLVAVAASSGPAELGWPMLQRNARHTGRAHTRPGVRLIEPTDGAFLQTGTAIDLFAEVVPGDAAIERLEFHADGQLLGVLTTEPYSLPWIVSGPGIIELLVVVNDVTGHTRSSPVVIIEALTVPPSYPVHLGAIGRGTVRADPTAADHPIGAEVTLAAEPGVYHAFSHWTDGVIENPRLIQIASSNRFIAVFTNTQPIEVRLMPQGDWGLGGWAEDYLAGVHQGADGNLLLAGSSRSRNSGEKFHPGFGEYDYWVASITPAGEKLWEATFGGTAVDELTALLPMDDGGWLLGGHSRSPVSGNKEAPHFGRADYWLVRIDAHGAKRWERSYGGNNDDILTTLARTSDGAILVGGYSDSATGGNKTTSQIDARDFWILKLDQQGDRLWEHTAGAIGNDQLYALLPTPDGGFLAGGSTLQRIPGIDLPTGDNFWVLRYDRFGRRQWDGIYGGQVDDTLRVISPSVDGGYLLGGDSNSGIGGGKNTEAFGGEDWWVIRIDDSGNQLWERTLGGSSGDVLRAIQPTPDGGFLLGGFSSSDVNGTKTVPSNHGDFWLVRLAHDGEELTQAVFGGGALDALSLLAPGPNGTWLAGGRSQGSPSLTKTTPNHGSDDYWVIQIADHVAPPGTPAVYVDDRFVAAGSVEVDDVARLRLDSTLPEAQVFYTLDGTTPDAGSLPYAGTVILTNSVVVRAVAYPPDLGQDLHAPLVQIRVRVTPPQIESALTWGHSDRIAVTFNKPLDPSSVSDTDQFDIGAHGTVIEAAPDPADPRRVILVTSPLDSTALPSLRVSGVTDRVGHAIAPLSSIQVNRQLRQVHDAGDFVAGFQDDFDALERDPGWIPRGAGGDVYTQLDGSMVVLGTSGDPNHLLYEGQPYHGHRHEVLARLRIRALGNQDGLCGGLGVGVFAFNSHGLNFHFRNLDISGPHLIFLDDFRAWGPEIPHAWQPGSWLWMRLLFQPDQEPGAPDLFVRVWPADGETAEPMEWLTWDRFPGPADRFGFAGLVAGSVEPQAELEVDYFLLKAAGLPDVRIAPAAIPVPPWLVVERDSESGEFNLYVTGQKGRSYRIESSVNLVDWEEFVSGEWIDPIARIAMPDAVERGRTFYRAVIP